MFTLLFGIIKGFFKLVGGIISFFFGGILLLVMCFFLVRGCCGGFGTQNDVPNTVYYNCQPSGYPDQHGSYCVPSTPPCQTHRHTNNFRSDGGRFGDASYMFEEYHYNHQFGGGTYVFCPVCHTRFMKNSQDNCFCTDNCWHRYNEIVGAWNRGDRWEVEHLGKNFR